MQLTDEEISSVEAAAYKGFEVSQVAHLLGKPADDFELLFTQENNPAVIAYMKGLYQAQSDLREAVINSAISGSSPAQAEMKKHLDGAMASLKISSGQ
jgi:hypothetical protein